MYVRGARTRRGGGEGRRYRWHHWNDGFSWGIFLSLPDNRNWFESAAMPENILDICRLQWDMRGPTLFLPSFEPGLDEIHPGPVMARSSSSAFLTPFHETTSHSCPNPSKARPPPSQSTSAAQFTPASFLFSSYPFIVHLSSFRSERRCQFSLI